MNNQRPDVLVVCQSVIIQYSCMCGLLFGEEHRGEACPECKSKVLPVVWLSNAESVELGAIIPGDSPQDMSFEPQEHVFHNLTEVNSVAR